MPTQMACLKIRIAIQSQTFGSISILAMSMQQEERQYQVVQHKDEEKSEVVKRVNHALASASTVGQRMNDFLGVAICVAA